MNKKNSNYHHNQKKLFMFFCISFLLIGTISFLIPRKSAEGAIDSISYYAIPAWNNTSLYRRGDFVQFQGVYYESLHENIDHQPNLNVGFLWQVLPTINPTETLVAIAPVAPLRLFDIALTLDNSVLRNASDLVATVTFTSFGTIPTAVTLDYKILDGNGRIMFNEASEVMVETERVVLKDFQNLNLRDGLYTLRLTTTYGDNVQDEFRQTFEVRGPTYYFINYLIFLAGLGIVGYIIYLYLKSQNIDLKRIFIK